MKSDPYSKGKSRLLAAIVCVVMLSTLVLSGCASSSNNASSSPSSATNNSGGNTPAPATEASALEPVTLTWYLRESKPNNADAVLKKFNEMVQAKINATVDFQFINPADYDQKMQLVMAASTPFDLVYTSSWTNKYEPAVARGAYIPLDSYIDQYPAIKNLFQPTIWDAVKVNGKIYGIPNNQIMGSQHGMIFLDSLVKTYNIDLSQIKSIDDITNILQTIKDNEPDVYPTISGNIPMRAFVDSAPAVQGYFVDTETMKVIEDYEETVLLPKYQISREWNLKGFFPPDIATMKNEVDLLKAGKVFTRYGRYLPGGEAQWKAKYGLDYDTFPLSESEITKSSVTSTLTAISATSKHPDRAMMLYNLLLTDKEIYNTLNFGLEGQDYTRVNENRIEPKKDAYFLYDWMDGNVFNSYLIPGQEDNVWEETKKLNDTSVVDPLIGFSFNAEPVQSEIARINAVVKEFDAVLLNGLDDPVKILKMKQEKLKAAGEDKVIAEINKQLAEWSQNK